ncbi:MAG: DNA-deoxyinosine glycosylase [Chlorobi bacterium]|nr:DNA-deoxyinosine glycosylase [Chlorobiota bacterium]
MHSFSFPPVIAKNAKIIILGTMPGKTSLEQNEYYAYKYNVFWKIMFKIFNKNYSDNYNNKLKLLKTNNTALWDSLQFCYRIGSSDSKIKEEIPNDFNTFFKNYSTIKDVFFNGTTAMKYYKKYIGFNEFMNYHTLPSTSPANAAMSFEKKLKKWSVIIEILNEKNVKL